VLPFDLSQPLLEFGTSGGRGRERLRGFELSWKSQTGNSHGSGSKKGTEEMPALDRILVARHGSPPLVMKFNCEGTVTGKVQTELFGINHISMWWKMRGFL
jgi:hypothetical protein